MEGCVKIPLPQAQLEELIEWSKDYALSHGLLLRSKDKPASSEQVIYPPFMLLPSPVPQHLFQQARQVQQDINLLMHRVAHDYQFLRDCLKSTVIVDDFTKHMWNIYETIRREGITQPLSLGLLRSDYMFDCGKPTEEILSNHIDVSKSKLRQIEVNTMSSSFGGLCAKLSQCHRATLKELGMTDMDKRLPENLAYQGLAEGIVKAWEAYGNKSSVVLFLVYEIERNIYDQKLLADHIKDCVPGLKVIRRSIQQVAQRAHLGDQKKMIIDGMEVAVVYMRSGYTPADHKSEKDWDARLLMERSRAIKCPNIYYHLAGTKKVQQMLASPGAVERFVSDPAAVQRIRATFAGLFSIDEGEDGDKMIQTAMEKPGEFVLKPQREGGGNNTYGETIREVLATVKDTSERSGYILMDRIYPTPCKNYALRSGEEPVFGTMVSELGIFGIILGSEKEVLVNKEQGHILRTKLLGVEEGGVAAGFGALDSPYLIDS